MARTALAKASTDRVASPGSIGLGLEGMELPEAVVACGDNLDFLGRFPDGKFKLVVTSPPYNLRKSYGGRSPLDEYLPSTCEGVGGPSSPLR